MNVPGTTTAPKTASTALSTIGVIALVLLIVGGLNWALVGLFEFDLVATLFGDMSALTRIVYVLVGVAGIVAISLFSRIAHPRG